MKSKISLDLDSIYFYQAIHSKYETNPFVLLAFMIMIIKF